MLVLLLFLKCWHLKMSPNFPRYGKYIVSLSVTCNIVTVVRCLDNAIISWTYVDQNAHEAFFAADNRTIWVCTRGVDTIELVDGFSGTIVGKISSYGGPSKVFFSLDRKTAYVNHIGSPYLEIIDAAHQMLGKVTVISTASRRIIGVLDAGLETNHPSFAELNGTTHAFVTAAALNATRVYKQPDPEQVLAYEGEIPSSGVQPHIIDLQNSLRVAKTLDVEKQGLQCKAENKLLVVEVSDRGGDVTASALVTIRPAVRLDMFQIIGRNLKLNTTYTVGGNVGNPRVRSAPQVLGFFKFKGIYGVDSIKLVRR
ncbi:uncharacterized protein BDR25DRAFT_322011 [Lindgomyces ingoldianus]|uniref:Uncharacterized protein n=1 Tax=Lindgomyces ingoldianus TaxID=673940 RepID=A0ACB6RBX2_9PLEO|nr:uncharacterized protein BDR25DRAFT_322011 [Lindgomyces ingoldianus]KAF2476597.1 hypothetical protein BDR25DRAFT_322011 [Lindgomyces ingoldianus]